MQTLGDHNAHQHSWNIDTTTRGSHSWHYPILHSCWCALGSPLVCISQYTFVNSPALLHCTFLNPLAFLHYRFKAVMTPFHEHISKKKTLCFLFLTWFLAFLAAAPYTFLYEFKYIYDSAYGLKPYCSTHEPSFIMIFKVKDDLKDIYNLGTDYFTSSYDVYVFVTTVYQYLVPLVYMSYTYSRVSKLTY